MERIRRVPTKWCRQMKKTFRKTKKNADSAPVRRGRRKYLEMYPEAMKHCTDELIRYFNQATSHDSLRPPGLSTMVKTFNSIVKQYSFNQTLQNSNRVFVGKTEKTPLKFSRDFIRKLCIDLGIHVVSTGSREVKDADPKEMEDWTVAVNELFEKYEIDPRANVQFDEFNDIRGITQKKWSHERGNDLIPSRRRSTALL